jgi:GNAT superfamily N-acetyltransferase
MAAEPVARARDAEAQLVTLDPAAADAALRAAMLSLYEAEWAAGTWPLRKTAESVERGLPRALALVLALAPPPAPPLSRPLAERLLGFCTLVGDARDPLLEDIIVAPAQRGRGLGRRLVAHALLLVEGRVAPDAADAATPERQRVWAQLREAPRVDLYCRAALRGFYEKCGFALARPPANERLLMRWTRPERPAE